MEEACSLKEPMCRFESDRGHDNQRIGVSPTLRSPARSAAMHFIRADRTVSLCHDLSRRTDIPANLKIGAESICHRRPPNRLRSRETSMEKRPVPLDTSGRDIHAEAARLRAQGPATLVE